jgi:LacI family transcriptional regulator
MPARPPEDPRRRAKAPTIVDVAALAGVSIKTVSRVVNGEANVADAKRAAVNAAVASLGYRPSASARTLAGARSFLIAMFFDNPSEAYLRDLQQGVVTRCRDSGYHLVVEPLDRHAAGVCDQIRATVMDLRVDGVVLTCPLGEDPKILAMLADLGVPFTAIGPMPGSDIPGVSMDDEAAAFEMTEHLVNLGHRRIGFIKGHAEFGVTPLRWRGYRRALEAHGLGAPDELVVQGGFTFQSGLAGAEALLSLADPPTAIFASNDDMALGVLALAHQRGVSVPGELSVVGFDDTPAAAAWRPRLTTVRQPIYEMGFTAADMLIARAKGQRWSPPLRVLPYALMIRETTGGVIAPVRRVADAQAQPGRSRRAGR